MRNGIGRAINARFLASCSLIRAPLARSIAVLDLCKFCQSTTADVFSGSRPELGLVARTLTDQRAFPRLPAPLRVLLRPCPFPRCPPPPGAVPRPPPPRPPARGRPAESRREVRRRACRFAGALPPARMSSSAVFEGYEKEYNEYSGSIGRKISAIPTLSGGARSLVLLVLLPSPPLLEIHRLPHPARPARPRRPRTRR